MRKPLKIGTHAACAVTFTREIIEFGGRLVRRFEPQKNLLLDQGLNFLGNGGATNWNQLFNYCVLGTGTAPTRRDSGVVTFTRSGTTVTASANFFEAADSGRLLKFDSGEECYLTYVNGTTATSNISGSVAASEGTVYYVNATAHQTEAKRTGALANDSGADGTSWNGTTGVLSMWRTFLFTAETGPVTYREIGWSPNPSAGANLSGRALLAGGGDSLIAGQIYKVKVQFDITISPTAAVAFVVPTGIWAGATGQTRIEGAAIGIIQVGGSGQSNILDPGFAGAVQMATGSSALQAPSLTAPPTPTGPILPVKALTADSYTAGSFTRTFRATFGTTEGNSTAIRSVYFYNSGSGFIALRLLFDSAQTKTSSQTLLVVWRKSWGRVLVN